MEGEPMSRFAINDDDYSDKRDVCPDCLKALADCDCPEPVEPKQDDSLFVDFAAFTRRHFEGRQ